MDDRAQRDADTQRLIRELAQLRVRSEILGAQRGRFIQAVVAIEATLDELITEYFAVPAIRRDLFFGTVMRTLGLNGKVRTLAAIIKAEKIDDKVASDLVKRLDDMVTFRNMCAHAAAAGTRGDDELALRQFKPDGTIKSVVVGRDGMEARISEVQKVHTDLIQVQVALRPEMESLDDGLRHALESLSNDDAIGSA